MRRLSNDQYRNVVADVFGPHITVAGQADGLPRSEGLMAVGARTSRITPSGFEKYYAMAKSVATQVVAPENRASSISCVPANIDAADDPCARAFFTQAGRLLYRRPLTETELAVPLKAASDAAATYKDFYRGLAVGLTGMMTTPQFLFVSDTTEPDPGNKGGVRLTAHAKAARLSFLLWNTTPDEMLLKAADSGALHSEKELAAQVERLMGSHRLEVGVRAFFEDFLHFEQFETLEKDRVIYPAFTIKVVEDAREQLLRTAVDHLIVRGEDYRALFTTRKTFVTGSLARIYRVPTSRPAGSAWVPYEFPADDPRAGILTMVGFSALASHPGRSSPTLRGRAIREHLLCQKVPDPPGDVDFSLFESPDAVLKTARERLTLHRTNDACAGCHKITDPIGLGLENLDGLGQYRTAESGAAIDASGDLDGLAFADAAGLGKAMHDNPATASCVVNKLTSYAVGRGMSPTDRETVTYFEKRFAEEGYRFPDLLKSIATSDAFFAVTAPPLQSANAAP
ncbi:MAG: DUF1592 domain-containing protein [Alphaproteobacteria bacterium]|nr:DUF1592 domain-containing protein [Alphaproteobacteria bacterium]